SKTIREFSRTWPLPKCAVAPCMDIAPDCAGAGVCCALNETPKTIAMVNNMFFMLWFLKGFTFKFRFLVLDRLLGLSAIFLDVQHHADQFVPLPFNGFPLDPVLLQVKIDPAFDHGFFSLGLYR